MAAQTKMLFIIPVYDPSTCPVWRLWSPFSSWPVVIMSLFHSVQAFREIVSCDVSLNQSRTVLSVSAGQRRAEVASVISIVWTPIWAIDVWNHSHFTCDRVILCFSTARSFRSVNHSCNYLCHRAQGLCCCFYHGWFLLQVFSYVITIPKHLLPRW